MRPENAEGTGRRTAARTGKPRNRERTHWAKAALGGGARFVGACCHFRFLGLLKGTAGISEGSRRLGAAVPPLVPRVLSVSVFLDDIFCLSVFL